jgi:sulfopyruvate decarboxylase subunit beta
MAMKRLDCLEILAKNRKDELVVTCWQSISAWEQVSPSKYNFQSLRTMGDCSTFALGLALARPDKRIFALEGDGSLCMALSSLVTIAAAAPANYYQFIMHNKMYETTGGQTIPNADRLDLSMIARGAGITTIYRYGDLATFKKELPAVLRERGPVCVVLDIIPDETHKGGKDYGKIRARDRLVNEQFKQALAE